jgi:hypothetical protein
MRILSFDVGIINLAYCILDSTECKIQHWEIITTPDHNNYSKLYTNLITELDRRKCLLHVDIVLIEKQPSFNPKMRIIAGCLQTYFFIRGVIDQPDNPICSVEFFSPKHKLKCYTGPELTVTGSNKYVQTKKKGVLIAGWMLEKNNESINFKNIFKNSKKKDDLSDCYLQALTYCTFKRLKPGVPSSSSIAFIEQPAEPVVKITKIQIKKDLSEYLTNQKEFPENTKSYIIEKYSILNLESLEKLCSEFSLKKKFVHFCKNASSSLQESIVL